MHPRPTFYTPTYYIWLQFDLSRKTIMDPQHVAEARPLLQSSARNHDSPSASSTHEPRSASQRLGLALVLPCLLLILLVEIGATLITTPMNQIQEGIICQMWHPGIPEPSKDVRCKDRDVQSELSTLRGWELTFGLIPGLLTAIPYGIIADRYGRKVVLSLSLFGITLVQAVDIIICKLRVCAFRRASSSRQIVVFPLTSRQSRLVPRYFPSPVSLARCNVHVGRWRPLCPFGHDLCHCK